MAERQNEGKGGSAPAEPAEDDPRLAFIYQEAVRGLVQQQTLVDNMGGRAGSLIFATAFVNSLLGATALADGLGLWEWVAVALLFAIGGLIVFMLWPYHRYSFRFDPQELLERYIEAEKPLTMSAMHRALALRIKADMEGNWRMFQRLRLALQIALILLLFDILAWLFAIAGV